MGSVAKQKLPIVDAPFEVIVPFKLPDVAVTLSAATVVTDGAKEVMNDWTAPYEINVAVVTLAATIWK